MAYLLGSWSHGQLSIVSLFTVLCIAVVLYFFCIVCYNLFLHPLRKYPGPKLWAVSRIPLALAMLSGKSHLKVAELHRLYGDVVRLSPNELSFIHPDAWNEVMGHRKRGQEENEKDPDFWRTQKDALVAANRENHGRMRRVLSHGFSAQAMAAQQPLIQGYVTLLIQRLKAVALGGQSPIEMTSWYNWATFDIIGDLSFGEPFGCLEDSKYHPWVSLIFARIRATAINAVLYKFPGSSLLIRLLIPKNTTTSLHEHAKLTREKVAKRLEMPYTRPDFMAAMTASRDKMQLSHPEIVGTSSFLIIAGSETTATTLSSVTYLLSMHKDVMKKLTEEVRSSFTSEDDIDLLSVQKLHYMLAVLNETLRIYPPVPGSIPRISPPGGNTVFGQYIPGNTMLEIWQWPMYHSPENFVLPESFIPERWLDDPRFVNDRKDSFQPFSFGPRNCLGRNLAYAEMRLILARMVWNFDFELDPRSQDWIERSEAFALWQKPDLYIRLVPRLFEKSRVDESPAAESRVA